MCYSDDPSTRELLEEALVLFQTYRPFVDLLTDAVAKFCDDNGVLRKDVALYLSISEAALSRYLKGERTPSLTDALRFGELLGYHPVDFHRVYQAQIALDHAAELVQRCMQYGADQKTMIAVVEIMDQCRSL